MGKPDREHKENKKYIPKPRTLIFSGSAKLPENVTAKHVFGQFSIELAVDSVDFKIVDVSCTILPQLGEKILAKALIGYEIGEGTKNAISEIENSFFSTTKKSIIAAVEDAYRKYLDYIKEKGI